MAVVNLAPKSCEACGLQADETFTRVRTTNGGLVLCRQCLDDINRKNPETALWKRLAVLLDKTWTERKCSSEESREISALWQQLGGRQGENT